MADVYAMVVPTEIVGKVRFTFMPDGSLATISLRSCAVLGSSNGESGPRPKQAPSVAAVARWLRDYMAGNAGDFPGVWANPGKTEFAQRVYAAVAKLPAGKTMSYGEVAVAVGSPGASRAVGTAMGRNPIPLVVP
ncbi:MAG: MGMT family protein [Planctomycetota bacterium]